MTTSSQAQLRSVNCTQCAAPLSLHGGHQVQSLACSYCGAVLDAKDEYKVVEQFVKRDRPPTVFELGMTGRIKDVEFTIIGMVQWRTMDGYAWLEFQIFSPTHGYAWLEIFRGHYIFSRRVRDLPNQRVTHQVRSQFRFRDREFSVFESYSASILYVEGELTFVAEAGDQIRVIEAIDPPQILSVEFREDIEEEYILGEYLEPEEVYAAFGIDQLPPKRYDIHPAQPFKPSTLAQALFGIGKYFAIGSAIAVLAILLFGHGEQVLKAQFSPEIHSGTQQSTPFTVSRPSSLLKLELFAALQNTWAGYDIVINRGDEPVFSMAQQLSFYSGYDGGESWSEGSQSAKAYFKLPAAGEYKLIVQGDADPSGGGGARSQALNVTIREGIIVSRYFIALLVLTLIVAAWLPLSRLRFESKRWQDEDDEDDFDD